MSRPATSGSTRSGTTASTRATAATAACSVPRRSRLRTVGLFGTSPDRGEILALENRVARLEEQVARLSAALAAQSTVPAAPTADVVPVSTPADAYAEALALAAAGNKIHAIKVVREQSGISLKAAKVLVESW